MKRLFPLLVAMLFITATLHAQDNLTSRRPVGQHTQTFSATPTFDAGVTTNWKMVLTGNITSSTLIGLEAGMQVSFEICQDGVGSRTFVWPSQLQNPIAIPSGANACITEIYNYDGTNGNIPTTTTGGGGGSGTISPGTVKQIAQYTASTTVSSDANLDDNLTNANGLTYAGVAGIFAPLYSATGTGAMTFIGNENACSGAAAGKDVLCLGDATSHSIQSSLNGASFFPLPQHQSTSPTIHGLLAAETFPQIFAIPTGTAGQPIISGGSGADPGPAALNLAGGSTIVSGILPKVNHPATTMFTDQVNTFTAAGTLDASASTVASALRAPNGGGLTVALNGAFGYDTTNNMFHGGQNSADSFFLNSTAAPANNDCMKWVVVSGNKTAGTAGAACGAGGGAPPLHTITAATGANSINNGDNAQTWNASLTTASKHWFTISENSASTATGTPYLWDVHTIASSTAGPVTFCAGGTTNCWNISSAGALAPTGSASLAAPGTNGQLLFNNSGTVAAEDPIVSQAYVNIWTAQDVTVTRTSAAVRNPVFSQTGTLQLTWASITGSPATCTLQIQGVDSQGNVLNNGSTFSVSPANGVTSQTFTSIAGLQTAAQIKAIFACVTYPTTGNLTLDFTPIPNVNVTNTIQANLSQVAGTTTSTGNGTTNAGNQRVNVASDNTPFETIPVATATTTDTTLRCTLVSAASTNSTSCKGSAGNVYGYRFVNTTVTIYYLRMYNSSSAPTCSSATGFIESIPIPPAGASGQAGGIVSIEPFGEGYGTGIGFCFTGGSSSTDNTNAATGVFGTILYK